MNNSMNQFIDKLIRGSTRVLICQLVIGSIIELFSELISELISEINSKLIIN